VKPRKKRKKNKKKQKIPKGERQKKIFNKKNARRSPHGNFAVFFKPEKKRKKKKKEKEKSRPTRNPSRVSQVGFLKKLSPRSRFW
jgi:hypothetical protein